MHGRVTLVAFWSRECGPSIEQIAKLDTTARALAARGMNTIAITDEVPSPTVRAFLQERKFGITPYFDVHGEAALAFNARGTPMYFVVDSRGITRFEYSSLDEVLARAAVLQN